MPYKLRISRASHDHDQIRFGKAWELLHDDQQLHSYVFRWFYPLA